LTARRTIRIALLAALAAALVVVPFALAGKGGGGGGGGGGGSTGGTGGSYTVTVSPAGPYVFGEAIYVTTNDPVYPNNSGPWIELTCYQNGVLVASGDHAGFSAGWYYNWPFYLGPTQSWSGGAANCNVRVFHTTNTKQVTDATTSFAVSG
jgi:hypothetical protein